MFIMILRMIIMILKFVEIFNLQKIENYIFWVFFLLLEKFFFYVIVEVGIYVIDYIIIF